MNETAVSRTKIQQAPRDSEMVLKYSLKSVAIGSYWIHQWSLAVMIGRNKGKICDFAGKVPHVESHCSAKIPHEKVAASIEEPTWASGKGQGNLALVKRDPPFRPNSQKLMCLKISISECSQGHILWVPLN